MTTHMGGVATSYRSQSATPLPVSTLVRGAALVVGTVAAIQVYLTLAPGYLVQPISPNLVAITVFGGVLAALALAYRWVRRLMVGGALPNARQIVTVAAGLWLIGYQLPMGLMRAGVQMAAFTGVAPASRAMPLEVIGSRYDWWAKRGGFWIDARLPDTGNVVSLPVSEAAYDATRPGSRVTLPVQTGRYGIRRILAPHPLTPRDLHPA